MRHTLNKRMIRFLIVKKTKLSNQNVNMQEKKTVESALKIVLHNQLMRSQVLFASAHIFVD